MAMKLFVKLMGLMLVLALAGPFIMKGPDGRPLMEIADVKAGIARQWRALTTDVGRAAGNENAGQVEIHRWRDENGQWHYSDGDNAAPDAEVLMVDPNVNVMDAPRQVARPVNPARETGTAVAAPAEGKPGIDIPLPMTISPGQVKQVVDDAKGLESVLQDREKELAKRSRGP